MDDPHAAARDRKRHKRRYGPTTTNPGMRIVMRDLARKAHRQPSPSESAPGESSSGPQDSGGPHPDRTRGDDPEGQSKA